MEPSVVVVVLNFNGVDHLRKVLRSLEQTIPPPAGTIVVDNGSTDGSQALVREHFPDFKLIDLPTNLGFAAGNNVGIRIALNEMKADAVLVLSTDTVVTSTFFSMIQQALIKAPAMTGILAPKLLYMDEPGLLNSTGHVFSRWRGRIVDRGIAEPDDGRYEHETAVVGACAAAAIYRAEMLREVGLFNEDFFMYYEDAELSWRAAKAGWTGLYVPQATIYHKGGGSSRTEEAETRKNWRNGVNTTKTVLSYGTSIQKIMYLLERTVTLPRSVSYSLKARIAGEPAPSASSYLSYLYPLLRPDEVKYSSRKPLQP